MADERILAMWIKITTFSNMKWQDDFERGIPANSLWAGRVLKLSFISDYSYCRTVRDAEPDEEVGTDDRFSNCIRDAITGWFLWQRIGRYVDYEDQHYSGWYVRLW